MTYIQKITEWIKSHYILSALIIVVIGFIGYKIFGHSNSKIEAYTVVKGDVIQKVIVSGKTNPVNSVNLGFETNGKVARSFVDVGSRVSIGQKLIELDHDEAYANYLKSQANLASEQAKLDEIKKGTRPEELAVSQTQVDNAKSDLIDAHSNMSSKILDAYSKSDDVIHNSVDQFFSNPKTNPHLSLTTQDSQLKNDIEQSRPKIETILLLWKDNVSGIDGRVIDTANSNILEIKNFVDKVAVVVNSQTSSSGLSQATVDSYKASISSARATILTGINNLTSATEKLNSAKSAIALAEKNLELKKVGSTPEAIKSAEARVLQFRADLQNASAQLKKMTLYSPLNGVVTKQDAKVGEIMTPGKSVLSIISDSDLEIESNISEINIGKVSIGDTVSITLDAFPEQTFKGTVTYIEPAETVIDGVVNYKVTIAFNEKYPQMKSGLTTNLEIITEIKNNVLRAPKYALRMNEGKNFVSKVTEEGEVEVPVEIGVIGQDGFVEIISGLSVGDVILLENQEI